MRTLPRAALIAIVLLFGQRAEAQFRRPYGGVGGYGLGGGYGGAGSTVAGSFLAGAGALTQAAGQYNLATSSAARNYQDAYEHYLTNQKLRVQTYFELRRMNASYRAETRRPPPTLQQIMAFNQSRTPVRLSANDLDSTSGKIAWPGVLRSADFADQRTEIEKLFAYRGKHPYDAGLGTDNFRQIRRLIDEMHDRLHSKIDKLLPDEYIAGNKFLKSLAYEARFDPGAQVAATP